VTDGHTRRTYRNRALTVVSGGNHLESFGVARTSDTFDNHEYKRLANPSINNMERDIYKQRTINDGVHNDLFLRHALSTLRSRIHEG